MAGKNRGVRPAPSIASNQARIALSKGLHGSAKHFEQCAELLLLSNRGLGPLAVTVLPIPFARRAAATACAAVQSFRPCAFFSSGLESGRRMDRFVPILFAVQPNLRYPSSGAASRFTRRFACQTATAMAADTAAVISGSAH